MNPILVGGAGRSGTTLLAMMLHSHPELAIMTELHFRGVKGELTVDAQFWARAARNGFTKQFVDAVPHVQFFERCHFVADMGERFACRHGAKRWGLKIMSDVCCPEVYREEWPDAQFVHILRDPRDMYASQKQFGWGAKDAEAAAGNWLRHANAVEAYGNAEWYMMVQLEELIEHPMAWMRFVCVFLGCDFDARCLEPSQDHPYYTTHVNHPSREQLKQGLNDASVGRWKNDLTDEEAAVIEDVAGKEMEEFGYA